jgi:hypothetical protein
MHGYRISNTSLFCAKIFYAASYLEKNKNKNKNRMCKNCAFLNSLFLSASYTQENLYYLLRQEPLKYCINGTIYAHIEC